MTAVPSIAKETLRLAKLRDYGILDTLPDATYDDIAVLVAQICQTPTALVSLVDVSRQWFKSKVGMAVSETPRDIAFCAHTIQQSEVLVVEDTHKDPKFRDNPLVTGPPYIRFYAGAPLITPDGHALGSLCVLDYKPRLITFDQRKALQVLSRQVVAQMELTRQSAELKDANEYLEQRIQERTVSLTSSLHRLLRAQATLVRKEAISRHNALHDPLTGLPNRNYFIERLEQSIQLTMRRPQHQYAVLFIDLDKFKPVNDSLGHDTGDRLLVQVAEQIKLLLRKSDLVARIGGDEFAVLLDDIPDKAQVIVAVKRLQEKLRSPFEIEGHRIFIGASIGITFSTMGYRDPEVALKDADTAMYHAKAQAKAQQKKQLKAQLKQQEIAQETTRETAGTGLNTFLILMQDGTPSFTQQFAIFDAEMKGETLARLTLEEELHQALVRDEFCLHYQPIFDLAAQQPAAFEVLLRWNHPSRGCIPAHDFIEVAEEIGITRQLCNQIMQKACLQQTKWRDLAQAQHTQHSGPDSPFEALPFVLHLNLSLQQIQHPQILLQWQAALDKYQLSADSFELEISEQLLLSNDRLIAATLQNLKSIGFKLCIDDFGSGHSSLSRLRQLDIDTLKIDPAFVRELDQGNGIDIAKTIIDFARSSDMGVIAKGIENTTQMQTLLDLGCNQGQGYWLSDALSASDIDKILTALLTFPETEADTD